MFARLQQSTPAPSSESEPSTEHPTQPTKSTKRFDQLPIGLNQRQSTYAAQFRGLDDEPGVPLYKFLELGNCIYRDPVTGRDVESEEARYCVDLNKPLGKYWDTNLKYFNVLHKLEWPGYESSSEFLCDTHSGVTRYQLGTEIARAWRGYLAECMEWLTPGADRRQWANPNPVVDGIEFKRIYLSEFYYDDEREWEARVWVELPENMMSLDFLRM